MRYVFAALLLLIALLAAGWRASRAPQAVPLTPTLTGETEYCLTCHADLPEISGSHPVETFGCVRCHGGERLALNADLAHGTLQGGRNPSALGVAEASCGGTDCHSGAPEEHRDHIQRVQTSVQATYAGAIATVLHAFGAQPDDRARYAVSKVIDPVSGSGIASLEAFDAREHESDGIQAFAENCLNCHLAAEPPPGDEFNRLSGCAACHTVTAGIGSDGPLHQLTTSIPYTQCNTCHNRGNYSLRDMVFHPRGDRPTNRRDDYYQPIGQFTRCEWTLDCIDCHTRDEVMGDGDLHNNQSEVQYVQCRTCHGTLTELPATQIVVEEADLAMRKAALHGQVELAVGDTILVSENGEPLWNTQVSEAGSYQLTGKATGQQFSFSPVMGSACEQTPDEQDSRYCHACHAVNDEISGH